MTEVRLSHGSPEERILVLAPMGRDAEIVETMLAAASLDAEGCPSADAVIAALEQGAGALLLTEEALTVRTRERLQTYLDAEPPWSELPVLLLMSAAQGRTGLVASSDSVLPGYNVTVLRRPVHALSLVSVLEASLRARRRQYEVRDYLHEREQQAAELERRVAERTAELTYANAILAEQVEVREKAQGQLEQLNSLTAAVGSSLDTAQVKETLARELQRLVGVEAGAILAYDAVQDRFSLRHSWGLPLEVRTGLAWQHGYGSFFEPVVAVQKVVEAPHLERGEHAERWLQALAEAGWRHVLAVPLIARGEVLGVLLLFSRDPVMREDQQSFYVTLGQQVAVAIANSRLYAEVLARGERLQQLAQQIISIQETERHRVSRELHDEAGQALTALLYSLAMLKQTVHEDPEAADRSLDLAVRLTEETMEQIRSLAHAMRTPSLDVLGLDTTLEGMCREFGERTSLAVHYRGTELEGLPGMAAISLYRVAQEALTNVARHARATTVQVTLRKVEDKVVLTIEDDGQGFDASGTLQRPAEGIGLAGLNERMETLGGRLSIVSQPGGGTRLSASVPLAGRLGQT